LSRALDLGLDLVFELFVIVRSALHLALCELVLRTYLAGLEHVALVRICSRFMRTNKSSSSLRGMVGSSRSKPESH
jgi:hypothetical protein